MAERPAILRIGDWRVDAELGELSRGGQATRVEPRTMRVLIFLAEHAGRVVEVQQLLDAIWPNVVVTQGSVYQAVANLRRILGDDSEHPRYIENIPRRGYRLIADVESAPTAIPGAADDTMPVAADAPQAAATAPAVTTGSTDCAAAPDTDASLATRAIAPTGPYPARVSRRVTTSVAVLGLAVFVLVLAWRTGHLPGRPSAGDKEVTVSAVAPRTVAVVPFVDLTTAPQQKYFADGLTSALIDRLTQFPGLLVIGQTSSEALKDSKEDVPTLARRLHVDYVVEGNVRGAGDQLRVSARLLRAADGFELWSQEFQRSGNDVLRIEEEVVNPIAHSLRVGLDTAPPPRSTPKSLEAYRLLLKAAHLNREQPATEGVRSMIDAALQSDPEYAEAWDELGDWWYDSMLLGRVAAESAAPQARAAYEHALKLDPRLSGAWVGLAWLQLSELDWSGAKDSIQRAKAINPADLLILTVEAELARSLGDWRTAIALERQRLQRDPLASEAHLLLAQSDLCAADYVDAERIAREALASSARLSGGDALVARALAARGDYASAVGIAKEEPDEPERLSALADGLFALGEHDAADKTLTDFEAHFGHSLPGRVGLAYAYRGQLDPAFRLLSQGVRLHEPELAAAIACTPEPAYTAFRADPRFAALHRDLGLDR